MFISIRKYHSTDVDEVARRAEDSFLPLLRQQQGFIAYYLVNGGDGWFSTISMFETEAGALGSAVLAADWVSTSIAPLLDTAPEELRGETLVAHVM